MNKIILYFKESQRSVCSERHEAEDRPWLYVTLKRKLNEKNQEAFELESSILRLNDFHS